MKARLLSAVGLIALAFAAAPAFGQTGPSAEIAANAPDTVYVWGQLEESLPQELAKYGSRVDVISGAEIKNGGFDDASTALQMLAPGLFLAPKNGAFDYVNASLLGGRNVDVIWLLDGVRISNRLYATTTPLDTVPAHMIDKIEVLKGGQSLFYGTSAMSGAINVVTKGFSKDSEGSLSLGADTNEGRHIDGYQSGGFGDSSYVVFGSHDEANGFQPYRDQDYQPSATDRSRSYNVTTLGAKYGYSFSDALKVSADYIHTDAKLDFAAPYQVEDEFNKRVEDILIGKVDWSPSDQFSFYVKGYYHWWTTHFTQIDNTIPVSDSLILEDNNEFWGFKDYGVNLLGQYKLTDNLAVLGGLDYQNYTGRDQVFLIAQQTEYVTAPFAQVRYTAPVLQGLDLAVGIRTNITKANETTTVWNASGKLALTDNLYIRGMAGTSFRLPSAYELFVIDPCCEQGNPNLVGEKSDNYELGFGGQSNRLSWEVQGFHRRIHDLIEIIEVPETRTGAQPGHLDPGDCGIFTDPTGPGCFDTFDNNGNPVTVNGGEATVTAQIGAGFSGSLDWTHTESKVRGGSGQISDIPKDTAKAILDWTPDNLPVGAGLSVAYVGDEQSRSLPAPLSNLNGPNASLKYGDYAVVDLNARWFFDRARRQRLSIRVENLFDKQYNTSFTEGFTDASGGADAYAVGNLGVGRTFHIDYTVSF